MPRRASVFAALALAAWWCWPAEGRATETGTVLTMVRRAPPKVHTVRTGQPEQAPVEQAPAAPAPTDSVAPAPDLTTVHLYVSTHDGDALPSAFVTSEDCGLSTLVMDGYASVRLEPNQTCHFVASRMDGVIIVESEPEAVELRPGEEPELELYLPGGRVGGLGVTVMEHPEGIEVIRVYPDGPADDLGILAGDLILEVEGVPAAELELAAFIRLLTGPEGTTTDIVLAWEDEHGWEAEALDFERAWIDPEPAGEEP